jgi:hypothetical protein
MDAREVRADQMGDGSVEDQLPCDERHYTRFLRKIVPGPERTFGAYVCDTCGMYFDEDGRICPSSEK